MPGVDSPEVWRGPQWGNHDMWVLCCNPNQLSSTGHGVSDSGPGSSHSKSKGLDGIFHKDPGSGFW